MSARVLEAQVMNLLLKAHVMLMRFGMKARVLEMLLVFVLLVVFVLLFSLSSTTTTRTTTPSTRPAARVWASGAKGLGFQFAAPAPGQRCSGPFS